jgi:hypothetical protein
MALDTDVQAFTTWATAHLQMLQQNPRSTPAFDPDWTKQRIDDVNAILRSATALVVTDKQQATLRNVILDASTSATTFLVIHRPDGIGPGFGADFEVMSSDESQLLPRGGVTGVPAALQVMGGMRIRVECVPELEPKVYTVKLTSVKRGSAYRLLTATLTDSQGKTITPAGGALLMLTIDSETKTAKTVEMRWEPATRRYYYYLATKPKTALSWVDAYVRGRWVTRAQYRGT